MIYKLNTLILNCAIAGTLDAIAGDAADLKKV